MPLYKKTHSLRNTLLLTLLLTTPLSHARPPSTYHPPIVSTNTPSTTTTPTSATNDVPTPSTPTLCEIQPTKPPLCTPPLNTDSNTPNKEAPPPTAPNTADKTPSLTPSDISTLTSHLSSKYKQPPSFIHQTILDSLTFSKLRNLDPLLLLAQIEKESSFNPEATSSYNAQGLLQVVPTFHSSRIPSQLQLLPHNSKKTPSLFNPSLNIAVATQYLRELLDKFPPQKAFLTYSGGSTSYLPTLLKFKKNLQDLLPPSSLNLYPSNPATTPTTATPSKQTPPIDHSTLFPHNPFDPPQPTTLNDTPIL